MKYLRRKIDLIDRKVIALIKERTIIVKKIGKYKKGEKLEIVDKNREKEVLNKARKEALRKGLGRKFISNLFKNIITESRRNEK